MDENLVSLRFIILRELSYTNKKKKTDRYSKFNMRTELLDKASSSPLYPYPFSYLMRGGESIIVITPTRRIKLYGSEIFTVKIPASH